MYQALYRKWRPKTFADVYGQEHIVSVLKNEISTNRISHAYLFCGTRGTGKTTCAKILAKAVNCYHPEDGSPCNSCEICKGIDDGSILDVVEIDAASNNGVDNVRDIRSEAVYSPAKAKKRVYIIDEVHMLSQGAFNALLKILEEPPEHVVFILATTEFYKIPATILSRCQRFDFRRITREASLTRLRMIAKAEGIEIEEDALALIERAADGSMRDALSLLDQCAGAGKEVTLTDAEALCGLSGRGELSELIGAITEKNYEKTLPILALLYAAGRDMGSIAEQLLIAFRDIMLLKTIPSAEEELRSPPSEVESLKGFAKVLSTEEILFALDTLTACYNRISQAADSRTELEVTLLVLCRPRLAQSVPALMARVAELERKIAMGGIPAKEMQVPAEKKQTKRPIQKAEIPEAKTDTPPWEDEPPAKTTPAVPEQNTRALLEEAKALLSPAVAPFVAGATVKISGELVQVTAGNDMQFNLLSRPEQTAELEKAFSSAAGKPLHVKVVKAAPTVNDPFAALKDKLKNSSIGKINP